MTVDMMVAKPSQSLVPLVPAKRSTNLKEASKYWVLISLGYGFDFRSDSFDFSVPHKTIILCPMRPNATDFSYDRSTGVVVSESAAYSWIEHQQIPEPSR